MSSQKPLNRDRLAPLSRAFPVPIPVGLTWPDAIDIDRYRRFLGVIPCIDQQAGIDSMIEITTMNPVRLCTKRYK